MVFVVTGCDEKEEAKTFACTSTFDKYTNTTTLTSENGKVGKVKVTYAYDNEAMGVTSFKDVTNEQIKTNMLTTLRFNDLLDYVFPNSVDVPINDRLSQVKEIILDDYPNLENISDDGLNVTNIWDWLEEKKNEYGDKFAISAEIVR